MAKRTEFLQAYVDLEAHQDTFSDLSKAFQAEYEAAIFEAAKKRGCRTKVLKKAKEKIPEFELDTLLKEYRDKSNQIFEAFEKTRRELEGKANDFAAQCTVHLGGFKEVSRVSVYNYSTQTCSQTYAKVDAGLRTEGFRANFPEVAFEITPMGDPCDGFHLQWYAIEANVESFIDAEIIRRRPDKRTLREVIKYCLQHGANIRVLFPMLPFGVEQTLGLDYFGNDVPEKK